MSDDLKPNPIEQAARVLAEKYTSPTGYRNPAWDIDKPDDDVTNPYHLTVPMEKRITQAPMVVFADGDGCKGLTMPTITEIVEVLADAGLLADPAATAQLLLALDAARAPHQASYVDPEHQGGNCIDVIMEKMAEVLRLKAELDGTVPTPTISDSSIFPEINIGFRELEDGEWTEVAPGVQVQTDSDGRLASIQIQSWKHAQDAVVPGLLAERDALKARIDAALELLSDGPDWGEVTRVGMPALRTVLLGDSTQDTAEENR